MEGATIMISSDDHSKDSFEASPAMSSAALTAASTATSEGTRLGPLFGNINKHSDRWSNFETPEPISDELREKVRIDLRKDWYYRRLYPSFRMMERAHWVSLGVTLDSDFGKVDSQPKARLFCNKPSGFYWSPARLKTGDPNVIPCPNTIFASIFGECHRLYDNQPNLDFGHFVANLVQITERGPDTIRGIIKAHISLYEKAEGILGGETQDIRWPERGANSRSPTTDFTIHSLFPALVLICGRDELNAVYSDYKRPDGYVRLRDFMHLQSLIIARTGWEHMLSKPISFESLQSQALPLDRADFEGRANVDVIRVPLPDAIRFIVDLEKREDVFVFQKSGLRRNTFPFTISRDRKAYNPCPKVFITKDGYCSCQEQWED